MIEGNFQVKEQCTKLVAAITHEEPLDYKKFEDWKLKTALQLKSVTIHDLIYYNFWIYGWI